MRGRRLAPALPLALLAGVLGACATKAPPEVAPSAARPGRHETGLASWYGPTFHGRRTSNGEQYNMLDLSAAHRTLPFGTLVRVTDRDTDRSLVVRINDRGPFVKGRIIDLSYTAAKILGMTAKGVARVSVEVLDPDEGERILDRQRDVLRRTGVAAWTDEDFAAAGAPRRGP